MTDIFRVIIMKQMSRIAARTTVLPAFAQLRRPCRNHPEPNETNLKTSSLCRTAIRFRNFRTPEPAHPRPRKTTITTAGTERATERSLVPAQVKPLTRNFYEFQYNRQIHLYSFFNSDVQKMFFWPIKKHLKIV